ncbi:hypothetical protein CASFOL_007918 [Castilleja foliolosa]|uniref:Protein TIC 214 n=1 Tax=Castilleja foliolosa TaxID=1961234 RepID=A0ABD3E305_9LAMI
MLAKLVNIYMFRCNNKMLFVTSSFVGWLIGHILFMKWLGLVLVWIRQNNSIFFLLFETSCENRLFFYRERSWDEVVNNRLPREIVFMPVRNVNHSIHSYGNGNEKQEILFLEIWTNGSLTPKEALHEASRNLIDLFIPFLHKEEENLLFEDNEHTIPLSPFTFHEKLDKLRKNKKKIALKSIFIDQFELSPRVYNCLKRSNIYTLLDLLNNSQEDLMKIEHFHLEDLKQILGSLEKHFTIDLPKKKF